MLLVALRAAHELILEVIGMGLHKNELSDNFSDASWEQDSKSTAFLFYIERSLLPFGQLTSSY